MLTQGAIDELKQIHRRCFEVRLKADSGSFAGQLDGAGMPDANARRSAGGRAAGGRLAANALGNRARGQQQIRSLRPQRSTLEEVFLKAVEPA